MKQRFSLFTKALCLVSGSLLMLNGCKEDTILNADIVPVGDTVNTIIVPDTITILSKTVFDDSAITSLTSSGVPVYHALGTLTTDPYAGKTNASIYFQIIPPSLGYVFPKDPDSAVLVLPFSGYAWGDTLTSFPKTFRVYEVANTDSLSRDSIYYSFTNKAVDRSNLLGSATADFRSLKDSVSVNGRRVAPHLRIKLNQAFIDKIKNEAANGNALKGYSDFLRFQRGLYVEPADTNSGNALFYFLLNGATNFSRANVAFYYTDKTSNNSDTVIATSFYFSSDYNAHYNRVTRFYPSGSPTAALLASTAPSDSVFVIQNEPGAAADLRFPFLKNLPQQPINKAELVITQYSFGGDNADKYTPPARIYPIGIDASGAAYTLLDRYPNPSTNVESLEFMGGLRQTILAGSINISQYVINIPREVQKAIVEKTDMLHLRINGTATFPGAYRLVAGGRGLSNPTIRVKLNIVYSKI